MNEKKPWLKWYDEVPEFIEVPNLTLYESVSAIAKKYPKNIAIDYLGSKISYRELLREIDKCADALLANGIKKGDSVMLSMPNIPNSVVIFYALNRIGAISVMTHPLSSPDDLLYYLNLTKSKCAVTVDMFYSRFTGILASTNIEKLILTKVSDYLSPAKRAACSAITTLKGLFANKKAKTHEAMKIPKGDERILYYADFMKTGGDAAPRAGGLPREGGVSGEGGVSAESGASGEGALPGVSRKSGSPGEGALPGEGAVVLFSGGTSANPKGVLLSATNFNALAASMFAVSGCGPEDSMLTILPVFHGFGLGVCVHTALAYGLKVILVPKFSAKVYIQQLRKHNPSFMAGVPTLFQALLQHKDFKKVSFSRLKGVYSGGDKLPNHIKERFDACLKAQGSKKELIEGYGLTECVTCCLISPENHYRTNSIGIPIPNISVTIANPENCRELPAGEEGEICIKGPTVMLKYLDNDAETNAALRRHSDGEVWLHTGDLGVMDEDGFIFFKGRIKRILKISGMAVYPIQVEEVLESHPLVSRACVVGKPDSYQMTSVCAVVVLKNPKTPEEDARKTLLEYCNERLIKWAVPRKIEFRRELPMTLVGKIAYTKVE